MVKIDWDLHAHSLSYLPMILNQSYNIYLAWTGTCSIWRFWIQIQKWILWWELKFNTKLESMYEPVCAINNNSYFYYSALYSSYSVSRIIILHIVSFNLNHRSWVQTKETWSPSDIKKANSGILSAVYMYMTEEHHSEINTQLLSNRKM